MKRKQQKKKYGWLRLALFGSLCILGLALAGCGQEQTPTAPGEEPDATTPQQTVAEQLKQQDFATMAEAKTEYLGDNSATGQILGFSLLAPYNQEGFAMQTETEPYGIAAAYVLPVEAGFSAGEVQQMADMTAMNCFVLINNVDEVELTITNAAVSEEPQEYTYTRQQFENMCEMDVRSLADQPQLWQTAVAAYVDGKTPLATE